MRRDGNEKYAPASGVVDTHQMFPDADSAREYIEKIRIVGWHIVMPSLWLRGGDETLVGALPQAGD